MRRSFLFVLMATLLLAAAAAPPAAAAWPERPVTVIVPYPPAGTSDVLARLVGNRLAPRLGQPVVIENRAGGAGNIGTAAAARAAPDGHTLVLGTVNTFGINPAAVERLPYDAVRDFAPVTVIADTPNVVLANPGAPFRTLGKLIAHARANPGRVSWGSTSTGGSPHMSGELLKQMAGVDMVHVPYRGGGPMLSDLIGGVIPLGFDNLPSAAGHIRGGQLRALAVTTRERWPGLPEVPTVAEGGNLPGYEVAAWFGLLAPANTPRSVVEALQAHVASILREPEIRDRLLELGATPAGDTPDAFRQRIAAEIEKWRAVARTGNIRIE
jgi:tripartite-type tricarboxylate transporter receptor subunit TctC